MRMYCRNRASQSRRTKRKEKSRDENQDPEWSEWNNQRAEPAALGKRCVECNLEIHMAPSKTETRGRRRGTDGTGGYGEKPWREGSASEIGRCFWGARGKGGRGDGGRRKRETGRKKLERWRCVGDEGRGATLYRFAERVDDVTQSGEVEGRQTRRGDGRTEAANGRGRRGQARPVREGRPGRGPDAATYSPSVCLL